MAEVPAAAVRWVVSVGTMLVEARAAAGMTVADVSAITKIRPAVVEAIERDDFTLCGGDAYARGQLRSIARALAIDPDLVLATFDGRPPAAEGGAHAAPPPAKRRRRGEPSRPRVPEQLTVNATPEPSGVGRSAGLAALKTSDGRGRSFNWTAAMLVAILVLVTIGVVSVVTRGSSGGGTEVVAPATSMSTEPVPPTPATDPGMTTPPPTPTLSGTGDPVAQAEQVEVTVDVIGDKSWLSVTEGKNATSLYEGLVVTGDSETFVSSKTVRVVVGNAGAVTLTVNGEDLGSPGGTGEVARLEFTPGEPVLS